MDSKSEEKHANENNRIDAGSDYCFVGEEHRLQKLAKFEDRVSGILGIIEAADAGKLSMPKSCRDLALNLARDSHSWLSLKPPTHEILPKIEYIDKVMSKIVEKIANVGSDKLR